MCIRDSSEWAASLGRGLLHLVLLLFSHEFADGGPLLRHKVEVEQETHLVNEGLLPELPLLVNNGLELHALGHLRLVLEDVLSGRVAVVKKDALENLLRVD